MKIYYSFLFLIFFSQLTAQDENTSSKEVQIIHADKLQFYSDETGNPIRKMVGNVQLKQDSIFLNCDSAFLLMEKNIVDMYGHVKITDGINVTATSNKLNYDGNTKQAKLSGKAILTDPQMSLYSETIYYDRNTHIGYYLSNGKIISGETVLKSKKAYYNTQTADAFFNENVVITDPSFNLDSDTLQYNTSTKITTFYGNTKIYNDESTIFCNNGSYQTSIQIATFGKNTTIVNNPQTLYADSLYYEKNNGYGKALKYFDWQDSEMEVSMQGTQAEYFEENKRIVAVERPLLKAKIEEDTLFLKGDTIIAVNDETKQFQAFKNAKIFKTDLQAIADSIYYSKTDSTLRLFQNPILWNEESEMKGDTILVFLNNGKIDKIHFVENAFIASQSAGKLFDQVKGKWITAYFVESKMEKMLVNKNAESLYFGKDDDENYIGGNQSNADKMWIYVKDKKIYKITFLDKPQATFTPLSQMTEAMLYLKNFVLHFEKKPKSVNDL